MSKIDKIIKESIDKVLSEEVEGYYREPLLEMARVGYMNGQFVHSTTLSMTTPTPTVLLYPTP